MLSRNISAVLVIFLLALSVQAGAQTLESYRIYDAVPGENLDIQIESSVYPTILQYPNHGSAAKFKVGSETQYRLRYRPIDFYQGLDTIVTASYRSDHNGVLTPHLQGMVFRVRTTVAKDDYFTIAKESVLLDVLSNDRSSSPTWISEIIHITGGDAEINAEGTGINYTPADFGISHILYRTCDGVSCDEARVEILVEDAWGAYRPGSITIKAKKNETVNFNVPSGFVAPSSYYFDGDLAKIRKGVWSYTPEEAFIGNFKVRYYHLRFGFLLFYEVNLVYEDPAVVNGWNTPDLFHTELDNPVTFDIAANDFDATADGIFETDLRGSLSQLAGTIYQFTPEPGFNGITSFTYASCKDGRCDTSEVKLVVHDYVPRKDHWEFAVDQGRSLHLPYQVPIDDFSFGVLQSSTQGLLTIEDNGQSIRYTPEPGFIGTDFGMVSYCTDNNGIQNCHTLQLHFNVADLEQGEDCTDICVYPGDLNNDGMVSISDVLPLGVHLASSGPSRRDRSIAGWYPRNASAWIDNVPIGVADLSHIDADGNGSLEKEDYDATALHYGKTSRIVPEIIPLVEPVPINLVLTNPEVQVGEEAIVQVSLGSASRPLQEMLGFNFSVVIDDQYVDSSSLVFLLSSGDLLGDDAGILGYEYSPEDGRLDVGFARFDHKEISGHGVMGEIRFIVEEDLNGFRNLPDLQFDIRVDDAVCLGADGVYASFPGDKVTSTIIQARVAPAAPLATSVISVAPNPTQDRFTVLAPDGIDQYDLFDLVGNKVRGGVPQDRYALDIDVHELPAGSYILSLQSSGTREVHKVEIVR